MADYDLIFLPNDKPELTEQNLMLKQKDHTEIILYKPLIL